jgi:hypothetical protein
LKFNRPFEKCGRGEKRAMRFKALLKRLFDKIVQDALPAGLASVLGGLLLTYLPIGHVPPQTTVKVTPASPQMMQLLRDEHGLIVDFVKAQAANEKSRGGADQEPQRTVAEAVAPAAAQTPPPHPNPMAASTAAKSPALRNKNPLVATSIPTAAAPASPSDTAALPAAPAARTDDSLLARSIGIKDRVVSATQHAVSATFGAIPSWFGSLGDRIGGEAQSPRPPADLVSASWPLSGSADR